MKTENYSQTARFFIKAAIVCAAILILSFIIFYIDHINTYALMRISNYQSPDDNYEVVISYIGTTANTDFVNLKVEMFSKKDDDFYSFFNTSLNTKYGCSSSNFEVTWLDAGAQILITSDCQSDQLCVLPFDQSKGKGEQL